MQPDLMGTLGFHGSFIPAVCSWPFSPLSISIYPSLGTQRWLQNPKGSPAPWREVMLAGPHSLG